MQSDLLAQGVVLCTLLSGSLAGVRGKGFITVRALLSQRERQIFRGISNGVTTPPGILSPEKEEAKIHRMVLMTFS